MSIARKIRESIGDHNKQIKKWGITALTVIMIFTTFPLDVLFASHDPEAYEDDVAYGYELDEMMGEEMLLDDPADINTGEEGSYPSVDPEITMPAVAPEVDHTTYPEATYPDEDEDDPVAAAPLSMDLTDYVTVLDWDMIDVNGESIFDIDGVTYNSMFSFVLSWNVDAPVGEFLQGGETFRLERPLVETQGNFQFINEPWQNFEDVNGVIIGQWRIQSNHIEVVFNENVEGQSSVTGFFQTGQQSVRNSVRLGGERYVTFAGDARLVNFAQHSIPVLTATQSKSFVSSSTDRILWRLNLHRVGERELTGQLGGNPLGTHFTPVPNFRVEDHLQGELENVIFFSRIAIPASLESGSPTYGFAGTHSSAFINFSSYMTRVEPNADEPYEVFRARLTPFQWGVWEDASGAQTFVAYFGTLGEDGPRITDFNPDFATVAADGAIQQGHYGEEDREALIDYFWAVHGDDNVINGHLSNIYLDLTERFAPVTVETPVSNTMIVTRGAATQNSSATGPLLPSEGGGGIVPPAAARLTLTDQITEAPLSGASFQLQMQSGSNWNNVANGSWTTNADGYFVTRVLPNGTYRFIQTSAPTAPYYHISSSNGFNSALDTVVSAEFEIVGGTEGASVEVENIRRFTVTYVLQNSSSNQSENVVHTNNPDNVPTPTRAGHVFLGWATTSTATSGFLEASDIEAIEVEGHLRFYAIWRAYPTITKVADVTNALIGDTIEYTITVNNSNNHAIPGEFTVVDVIDLDLVKFVDGSLQINGEYADYVFDEHTGELRVVLDPLAMGNTAITFDVIVLPEAGGQTVINVAVLETPGDSDFPPTLITPEVPVEIYPPETPQITKAANVTQASVADVIEYTITVNNPNNHTLEGEFVMVDVLDLDLVEFVEGSVEVNGEEVDYNFDEATGTLRVILEDLVPGNTVVTFEVIVLTEAAGLTITNVAILEVPEDSDLPNPPPTPPVEVEVYPGPSISKAANVTTAAVGDIIEYTITVNNPDSSALEGDFVVADVIDLDLVEFITGSVQVDGEDVDYNFNSETGELRVVLNPLVSGDTVITFEVEILASAGGATVTNVAILELPEDSDLPTPPPSNEVEVEVTVLAPTIAKAANRTTAEAGDLIEYTITVNNPNAVALVGDFVVVDVLDLLLVDFVDGSVQVDGEDVSYNFNSETGELRVVLNPLVSGDTVITFEVEILASAGGATVTNVAILELPEDSDLPEPPPSNEVGVEIYPEDDQPLAPIITKEANRSTAEVGDEIVYTIAVRNPNPFDLLDEFVVVDVIDLDLVNFIAGSVRVDSEPVDYDFNPETGELRVTLDLLPVGYTVITFVVEVREDAAGETIINVAVLEVPEDSNVPQPPPTEEVPVEVYPEDPDVLRSPTITKAANVTTAEVGDTITYRITVNNPNDEPLEGEFVVVDEIDISLVDFVAGSVCVNGEVVAYNFNAATGELRVILDPLAIGTTNVTFDVVVREDAAGETVVNVAVLEIPEDGDFDFPPVPPTPPVDVEVEPEPTNPFVCEDIIYVVVDEEGNVTVTAPPELDYQVTIDRDGNIVVTLPPGWEDCEIRVVLPGDDWEYDRDRNPGGSITIVVRPPANLPEECPEAEECPRPGTRPTPGGRLPQTGAVVGSALLGGIGLAALGLGLTSKKKRD